MILQIDLEGNNIVQQWKSIPQIKGQLPIDITTLLDAIDNKRKYIGYYWVELNKDMR